MVWSGAAAPPPRPWPWAGGCAATPVARRARADAKRICEVMRMARDSIACAPARSRSVRRRTGLGEAQIRPVARDVALDVGDDAGKLRIDALHPVFTEHDLQRVPLADRL